MLAPESVNVPVPDFVNEPEPVVIAAIADVPTLSTVNPILLPVTPPDNVNEPASICTSDANVNNVTAPEIMFVPVVLRIAPFGLLVNPRPLTVIGSATVKSPDSDNAAPDDTVVPVPELPNDEFFVIATTPAETVVVPV